MAYLVNRLRRKKKNRSQGLYSTVSSSDLTPGSVDVWIDLPDEIKFDSSLEPFKRVYEEQHGKLTTQEVKVTEDGHKSNIIKKTELQSPEEDANNDPKKDSEDRLMEPVTPTEEKLTKSKKRNKLQLTLHAMKLSALFACWILLTASLITNREKSNVVLHTAVEKFKLKEYDLQSDSSKALISITLSGPFNEATPTNSDDILKLWLHRESDTLKDIDQNSEEWIVNLQTEGGIDFSPSVTVSKTLVLKQKLSFDNSSRSNATSIFDTSWMENGTKLSLRMLTRSNVTVPLTISYQLNGLDEREGIIYSTILLCTLYFLIVFEVINRTIAALLSSSLAIAVLALSGARPTLSELVSWLDIETLLLLFSMMILVAILAETGLFDHLAVMAFEVTGGHTWPLINCLCFFTAFFSTFLDNVTTVLLMTPVTIRLCEVMYLNPVPVLMCMVIFSNVGGAATPVGDPPNVIIASHRSVLEQNINFATFTLHMGVGVLLVCVQTYVQLRYMFRDMNKLRHSVPRDILELQQQIAVWKRAAASLSSYSRDEDIVRRALEKKVNRLNSVLVKREAGGGTSKKDPTFTLLLKQMKEKYHIRDKQLLVKSAICVSFVVIVFFLHAIPELQRLSLGWTALLGALLLLLLADREDLEPILARVEWSTLLFFASLFVLMEALSKLGLITWIGKMTEAVIMTVNEESRLAIALMLILWVSGVASAFVDNIPLTTMMVRVIAALADPNGLGLPLPPLVWALSLGACLGGNGTLIGASANVVCAGVAEKHGYRFTFVQFLKTGFPIMIGNLIVASIYLAFCHVIFTWH